MSGRIEMRDIPSPKTNMPRVSIPRKNGLFKILCQIGNIENECKSSGGKNGGSCLNMWYIVVCLTFIPVVNSKWSWRLSDIFFYWKFTYYIKWCICEDTIPMQSMKPRLSGPLSIVLIGRTTMDSEVSFIMHQSRNLQIGGQF